MHWKHSATKSITETTDETIRVSIPLHLLSDVLRSLEVEVADVSGGEGFDAAGIEPSLGCAEGVGDDGQGVGGLGG